MTRYRKWTFFFLITIVLGFGTIILKTKGEHAECRNVNNPERSIAACTRLIDLKNTTNPEVYFDRAMAVVVMGETSKIEKEQVISDLTSALGLSSKNPIMQYLVLQNRGHAFLSNGQFSEALSDLNSAISMNMSTPYSPAYTAYRYRGLTYAALHRYDLAIADLSKTVELHPQDALAYSFLSWIYLNENQLDLALQESDQAILVIPQSGLLPADTGKIYLNRAKVYYAQHNYDQANKSYNQAIALDPGLAVKEPTPNTP